MLEVKARHISCRGAKKVGELPFITTSGNANSFLAARTHKVVWVGSAIRGDACYHNLCSVHVQSTKLLAKRGPRRER